MTQSANAADREPVAPPAPEAAAGDLLELFSLVTDGRSGQGRDHPVAAVLALSAAAVVAGMQGYTAIAGWVKDVPAPALADLYMRAGADPARPPSKATIWRVLTDADAEVLDATVGRWLASRQAEQDGDVLAGLMPVRLDGRRPGARRTLMAASGTCWPPLSGAPRRTVSSQLRHR